MASDEILELADARQHETYIADVYTRRLESWRVWRERVLLLDRFISGDWAIEMPDGTIIRDKPKIENLVVSGIQDTSKQAGEYMPQLRVEPLTESRRGSAQQRQQVVSYYWQLSRLEEKLVPLFRDMISTGLAALWIWPDWRQDRHLRFPLFRRIDPRGLLLPPGFQAGDPLEDALTLKYVKLRQLASTYPEAAERLRLDSKTTLKASDDILVVCHYTPTEISEVALHKTSKSQATLYKLENETGLVPIVPLINPSADGQPRGQFDSMLAALAAKNRLVTYMLDYADQLVYAPLVTQGGVGSIPWGPNARIDLTDDQNVTRLPPASAAPQLFALMGELERDARRGGIVPEVRAGDSPASILTGAGVNSLLGGYGVNVRVLRTIMENALEQANIIAQTQDRIWCDSDKQIVGYAAGQTFRTSYRPSKLLREGETGTIVSYGVGIGTDAFNRDIMVSRRAETGLASRRWARTQMDGFENLPQVESEIIEEALLQAALSGMQAQAAQGNLQPAGILIQALKKKMNPMDILDELIAVSEAPASAGPTPIAEADTQLRALARGAQSGNEEGTVPESALPPLSALRIA